MIGGWLGGRWAVGGAAWLAFAAAVWFAGDALALGSWRPLEAPAERVALIAAVALGWLGWELLRARRTLEENERLLAGLAGGAGGQDSSERAAREIQVLQMRFQEALEVLKKSRFRGAGAEKRTVAELPWYMFIGAPGSGKTTALLNAGLRFPLGDPRAGNNLRGVGGTRNCDWWFTDEAVMLDTAGRYTTQESDAAADAAAWLGFLELLKRFRPRQPLNGVIVTLSAADLAHWKEDEIQAYGVDVRERVWELTTRLGVRVPVYVMVTKSDLLAGFNEFFSALDAQGRAQVWGMTFDPTAVAPEAGGLGRRFDEEFGRLERRLYGQLPGRLQEERDLQRRAAIYRFPQQFRGIGPMISSFLDTAFSTSWLGEPPLVRGVYFTSGTQEGSPIDRVLGTLARRFNLERKVQPPIVGSGKSFFLRRLLREVIFGESGLAGTDPVQERARRTARLGAYASLAAASVLLALGWTISWLGNRALVNDAEERVAAVQRELQQLPEVKPGDEAKLVQLLNRLRELRLGEAPASARFGLYQGAKLDAQAARAYRNALRETLLPLVESGAMEKARLPENLRKDLAEHVRAARAGDA